jgi:hypothetical protein
MMAIEISEDAATGYLLLTFTIPDDGDHTIVSVVGSFNNWLPGTDTFASRGDGFLAASVTLTADDDVHFRYLRTGGIWFDDHEADEITAFGSVITSPRGRLGSSNESLEDDAQGAPDAAELAPTAPAPSNSSPARGSKASAGAK